MLIEHLVAVGGAMGRASGLFVTINSKDQNQNQTDPQQHYCF